eukprot:4530842-Alexandrium_andersonii.AAC.1
MRRSMNSCFTAFVGISAGFLSPGHFTSSKSPDRNLPWTQSCPTARCRTRPMPDLRQCRSLRCCLHARADLPRFQGPGPPIPAPCPLPLPRRCRRAPPRPSPEQ